MNKSALRANLLQQLKTELARQADAAALARDEAISEESRPENKWDTHSQEAAYLAEGQARLAADIRANLELYATLPLPDFGPADAVAVGAVVVLKGADGRRSHYLLGPRAGGLEVEIDGTTVLVITPSSPLGRQLPGRRVGDTVTGPGRAGLQRVVAIL